MLSPNHPWAGFKDELDMPEETWEIHGGITFYEKHRDCTVIGWDANHSFDDENPFTADETESETRRLARMCAKVKV